MTIEKVECVMLECDNCKEPFESYSGYSIYVDEQTIIDEANDSEWKMDHEDGKHYCDKCYHYNDEDEFVLNTERTKDSPTVTK